MAGAGRKTFTSAKLTSSDVNGYLMDQTVMVFDDTTDRDSILAAVLAEGLICQTLDDDTIWRYDGSAWDIVVEKEKPWTPTVVQGSSVSLTVNSGAYQRTFGTWTAGMKVTFSGAGTASEAIYIPKPFSEPGGQGVFRFYDSGLAIMRVGMVDSFDDDLMFLWIDGAADAYGVAATDDIESGDILWMKVHGSLS